MAVKITYRHNAMDITSLDTFFSVRGGFHGQIREVYFVRALGECAGFSEKLQEIDRRMGMESVKGRTAYLRIGALPGIYGVDAVRVYSEAYDKWKRERFFALPHIRDNALLRETVSDALEKVEGLYRGLKKTVSDSMLRNFGIKLLFWLEEKAGTCLEGWDEKGCRKVVLEQVGKDQEYLFGYFLTLLGCDVLILENREAANLSESLKGLSKTMVLGAYGTTVLPPYIPQVLKERERNVGRAEKIIKQRSAVGAKAGVAAAKTEAAEHTFEELARMASSIVMITVHDKRGQVLGTGSGIMIGRNGYILTNYHVVAGGCSYSVRIEDDEESYWTDEVIKYHHMLDLAVIRIDRRLRPLPIYRGTEKLVRGQRVVAIGSPLGLFNSVSDGIISGFRNIRDTDMIQFTAPISPGSSGGAVLNMYGEVIGISTAGIDHGQNINLAVGYESILMFAQGFFD